MKKTYIIIFLIIIASLLVSFNFAEAVTLTGHGGVTTKLGEAGLAEAIGIIIKILLSVVGAVALLAFIYGGYLWLASAGIGEKINAGKTVLIWATVGLIIVMTSYILVDFVIYALVGDSQPIVVTPPPNPSPFPTPPPICSNSIDDDGDGLIDMDDPGCENPDDNDEYNDPPPQCSDGIDNDGDGTCDTPSATCTDSSTPGDPECENASDDNEAPDVPPVLPPTCKWLQPFWPYDCEAAGLHCVDCPATPNADGNSPTCANKAGYEAKKLYSNYTQGTCHVCVGTYVGCEKGQACCCVDCEKDSRISEVAGKEFTCWDAICTTGVKGYFNLCGHTALEASQCAQKSIIDYLGL